MSLAGLKIIENGSLMEKQESLLNAKMRINQHIEKLGF